jgi:hypothetical protein
MRFEDKPIDKENFLPPRKRPYNPNPPRKDCYIPPSKPESLEIRTQEVNVSTTKPLPSSPQNGSSVTTGIHQEIKPTPSPVTQNSHSQEVAHDEDDTGVYCICKEPYNSNIWMIGCDTCQNWFHGKCVGITALEARKIKNYVCAECVKKAQNNSVKPIPSTTVPLKKPLPNTIPQEKKRPIEQMPSIEDKRKKKVTTVAPQVGCKSCLKISSEKLILCERCRSGYHASCVKVDPMVKFFICGGCKATEEKKVLPVSTFWPPEGIKVEDKKIEASVEVRVPSVEVKVEIVPVVSEKV